jgi:uncharacterized protein
MVRTRLLAVLLLVFLLNVLPLSARADPQFPPLTGRVVDDATIIIPEIEEKLSARLETLEKQTGRQLVIVTVPDLQGYDIADYGYQLGRHWGIGDKKRNDGVLLIVAPNERKVRIEVGYGLEGVLTDGLSSLIINNDILPYFRTYDMNGGIEAGTNAIIAQLTLPDAQAQKIASEADDSESIWPMFVVIAGVLLAMAFLFWLIIWFGDRFGGSSSGGHWLFRSSSGSSWSSSGGGFSGGGGSFGGGGASGRW